MSFLVGRKTYKKVAKSLEVLNNIACPFSLSYSLLSIMSFPSSSQTPQMSAGGPAVNMLRRVIKRIPPSTAPRDAIQEWGLEFVEAMVSL
jgi:hypothetical protein